MLVSLNGYAEVEREISGEASEAESSPATSLETCDNYSPLAENRTIKFQNYLAFLPYRRVDFKKFVTIRLELQVIKIMQLSSKWAKVVQIVRTTSCKLLLQSLASRVLLNPRIITPKL
jgi:hypothetical protein